MKKLLYILSIIVFTTSGLLAQGDLVVDAYNIAKEGKLDEGKTGIDKAIVMPEYSGKAKSWYVKGYIYKELFKAKEVEDPNSTLRTESLNAYKKSLDLEPQGEFSEACMKHMQFITTTVYNGAVKALNAQDFKKAHSYYVAYIGAKTMMGETSEDKIIFYAGYTAYMIGDFDAALVYFNQVKEKDYQDPLLYFFLGKIYHDTKKVEKAIEVLEEGKQKFPLAKDINDLYISYKLERGELTALEKDLKKAISLTPDDLELQVTLALLYEKKAELEKENSEVYLDKAKETYKEIVAKNENHMRANYNLALLFYNQAVNIMNNMDDDDDDLFALNQIQDQCIELFRLSLPYFNKAHELEPHNKEVLIGLAGVHFSLNNMEKHEEFNAKLDKLKEQEGNK